MRKKLNVVVAGLISAAGIFATLGTSAEAARNWTVEFNKKLQPQVSPQSIGEGIKAGIGVVSSEWKAGKTAAAGILDSADAVLSQAAARFNDLYSFSEGIQPRNGFAKKILTTQELIKKNRDIITALEGRVSSMDDRKQRFTKAKDLQGDDFVNKALKDIIILGNQICDLFR